ncbi:MAG: hypothetical protein AB4038_14485 [Prochloraceae cyanobacterium]
MSVLICPGFHSPQLTQSFLQGLQLTESQYLPTNWLVFPTQDYLPVSVMDILTFLQKHEGNPGQAPPVVFISFSAGVVGAMLAAIAWQKQLGKVKAFFALDGWGVPLTGNFPIHRLSHDYFTHWSSPLLGAGKDSFYAEPAVEHLELWRSPQTAVGWWVKRSGCEVRCSAAKFLTMFLSKYQQI